jgi:hypothetical protein
MKVPLNITVLEYLVCQDASIFPIQHTQLPDFGVVEVELLHEIAKLERAGYIDARVVHGNAGEPALAAITRVTLQGDNYLESWKEKTKAKSPLRKMSRWSVLGVGLVLGGVLTKSGEFLFELLKRKILQP